MTIATGSGARYPGSAGAEPELRPRLLELDDATNRSRCEN